MINDEKKRLRAEALARRNAMTDVKEKSHTICRKVTDSLSFKKAGTVFVYLSFRSEVRTEEIIAECFAQGKRVCVPVVGEGCSMTAVEISKNNGLVENGFGISEPADKTKTVGRSEIDLCIAPGSVFDAKMNRIGYGKGFYDRFLQNQSIKTVALAFDCQIADSVPCDEYDKKMDAIVTESRVFGDL